MFAKKPNKKSEPTSKVSVFNTDENPQVVNNESVEFNLKKKRFSESSTSSSDSEPEKKKKLKFGHFFSKKGNSANAVTVVDVVLKENVQVIELENAGSVSLQSPELDDGVTANLADTESSPESLKERKRFSNDEKAEKGLKDSSTLTFVKLPTDQSNDELASPVSLKTPEQDATSFTKGLERRSWRIIDDGNEMEIIDERKIKKAQEKSHYRKRKSRSWVLLPFLNKKEEEKEIKINGIIGSVENDIEITNKKKKRSASNENISSRKSGFRNSFQNLFNLNKNKGNKQNKEKEKEASETSDSDSDLSPVTFKINDDDDDNDDNDIENQKYKRISSEPQLTKLRTLDPEELLKDEETRKSLQNLSSEVRKKRNFDSESSTGSSDSSASPLKFNKFGQKIKSIFTTNDSSGETSEHSRENSMSSLDKEQPPRHKSRFLEFFRNLIKRNPKTKTENVKKRKKKIILKIF